jgi:hypothetical protein
MALAFYLLLVFFSEDVNFSWGWAILAFLFSSQEAKKVYRFTTDPQLDGKEVRNC